MVEISLSGSGEGLGWVTNRGYSTTAFCTTDARTRRFQSRGRVRLAEPGHEP